MPICWVWLLNSSECHTFSLCEILVVKSVRTNVIVCLIPCSVLKLHGLTFCGTVTPKEKKKSHPKTKLSINIFSHSICLFITDHITDTAAIIPVESQLFCYQAWVWGTPWGQDSQRLLGYSSLSVSPLEAPVELYHSTKISVTSINISKLRLYCCLSKSQCGLQCGLHQRTQILFWLDEIMWTNRMSSDMLSYDCMHFHYRPERKRDLFLPYPNHPCKSPKISFTFPFQHYIYFFHFV